jgi:hypothetical protein
MERTTLSIRCNNEKTKNDIRYMLKMQAAEKRMPVYQYLLELLKNNKNK